MNKYEKDIFDNENLASPGYSVLDKAKSELSQKQQKRRLNKWQVFAIVSACIVVLLVCSIIPAMIPANSQMPYIQNEMLQTSEITSLEDSVLKNSTFLYFDKFERLCQYDYDSKTMFIEEFSNYDDALISLLICVGYRDGHSFEKEKEYLELLGMTQECSINDTSLYWASSDDVICITFWHNEHQYYLKIDGDMDNWQTFLQKELF